MSSTRPCPVCGAPAPLQPVYKHQWICCARCGNLSRLPRERLLVDLLPTTLRARLPAALRRDEATLANPEDVWFKSTETRQAAFEMEADSVVALLSRLEVPVQGSVLDLCGGPGHAAARLARRAQRVVLLEHGRIALAHARERLGLDARFFDFDGPPLPEVVDGAFDLILCRFALGWCEDLPKLATGLTACAAPDATLLLSLVAPTRAALLTTAVEDFAPWRFWSPAHLARVFAEAGWLLTRRFEPFPPMPFWAPRGPRYGLLSLPWALWPGPLDRDPRQRHAGLLLRYVGGARSP